ncbi:hypothetical protein ZWY2020_052937 [Hordeum vulgare]|nr:hypothetical protein ZWY2020_052937 [Hordeum vulgare]
MEALTNPFRSSRLSWATATVRLYEHTSVEEEPSSTTPRRQRHDDGRGVSVQAPEASSRRYVRRVDEVPSDDDWCDDVLEANGRGTGDDDPFDIPVK